jgi:hypothetical protein
VIRGSWNWRGPRVPADLLAELGSESGRSRSRIGGEERTDSVMLRSSHLPPRSYGSRGQHGHSITTVSAVLLGGCFTSTRSRTRHQNTAGTQGPARARNHDRNGLSRPLERGRNRRSGSPIKGVEGSSAWCAVHRTASADRRLTSVVDHAIWCTPDHLADLLRGSAARHSRDCRRRRRRPRTSARWSCWRGPTATGRVPVGRRAEWLEPAEGIGTPLLPGGRAISVQ